MVNDANLAYVDVNTGESGILGHSDMTISRSCITLFTINLTVNRLYNITITAGNRAGSDVSRFQASKDANKVHSQLFVSIMLLLEPCTLHF